MSQEILSSPIINKEWAFTCRKCYFVPKLNQEDDYVKILAHNEKGSKFVNLRWPKRCRECERDKKRNQRLKKAIKKIYNTSYGIGEYYWEYRRPKMITFALPNAEYNATYARRNDLVKELKLKLKKAWKILQSKGLLGGTYVLECTSRLIWSDLATEKQQYKHHPHGS